MRASRLRYDGLIGSSSPNAARMSGADSLARKYESRQPGLATGSKVGFGMNRLTLPPTRSRFLPSISAHCIARRRISLGMNRMNASSAS